MPDKIKKQIVFIEPNPTVYMLRMARGLKLTGKYELILITLSNVNKEFYSTVYDKIFVLELSHKLDRNILKTAGDFFKKISSKDGRDFFKQIKNMKPYLFHITGPDLFSLMTLSFLNKKTPKIYYANDLWSADERNFFFTKKFWVKGEFQKLVERICFSKVDGILNKTSFREFEMVSYKINAQKMALPLTCLEEWTFLPKRKSKKEIHIVYAAGPPHLTWEGEIPFKKIMEIITSQKIHFHTYGPCMTEKETQKYIKESKKNKYYHYHEKVKPDVLNKEMSKYHYGIIPYFF